MKTKAEIKEYIVKCMDLMKEYPQLNYPADMGKSYYQFEQKNVDVDCFRYGRTLTRIWLQQKNNRLLLPDMPDMVSELCIELKEVHRLDINLDENISQFCEYYTRWKNLEELINGKPITYENMFKWSGDCTRITNIILKDACKDGVFVGFGDVDASKMNQLHIIFDVLVSTYLVEKTKTKGNKDISEKIFLRKFGWNGYRTDLEKIGNNDIRLKYSLKEIYEKGNNKTARKNIELYLSPK